MRHDDYGDGQVEQHEVAQHADGEHEEASKKRLRLGVDTELLPGWHWILVTTHNRAIEKVADILKCHCRGAIHTDAKRKRNGRARATPHARSEAQTPRARRRATQHNPQRLTCPENGDHGLIQSPKVERIVLREPAVSSHAIDEDEQQEQGKDIPNRRHALCHSHDQHPQLWHCFHELEQPQEPNRPDQSGGSHGIAAVLERDEADDHDEEVEVVAGGAEELDDGSALGDELDQHLHRENRDHADIHHVKHFCHSRLLGNGVQLHADQRAREHDAKNDESLKPRVVPDATSPEHRPVVPVPPANAEMLPVHSTALLGLLVFLLRAGIALIVRRYQQPAQRSRPNTRPGT
jgi:hypothetical protein